MSQKIIKTDKKNISPETEVNERVKKVRKMLKVRQNVFSKKLGFNQSYYSEVENGKKNVTARLVLSLRDNYNISSDWMYSGLGEPILAESQNKSTHENVPILTNLEKGTIYEGKKAVREKEYMTFTDDDLVLLWMNGNLDLYDAFLSDERNNKIRKQVESQAVTTRSVFDSIENELPEYRQLIRDLDALKSFEDFLGEVYNNSILKALTQTGINSERFIQFKDFDSFKTALIAEYQHLKPYIKAVSVLASAMRDFVNTIHAIGEEKTGIEEIEYSEYMKKHNGFQHVK